MKITRRMLEAAHKYHADTGKWPGYVCVGHNEAKELNDQFGYFPNNIAFAIIGHGELTVAVHIVDTPTELVCSING